MKEIEIASKKEAEKVAGTITSGKFNPEEMEGIKELIELAYRTCYSKMVTKKDYESFVEKIKDDPREAFQTFCGMLEKSVQKEETELGKRLDQHKGKFRGVSSATYITSKYAGTGFYDQEDYMHSHNKTLSQKKTIADIKARSLDFTDKMNDLFPSSDTPTLQK